MPLPTGTDTVGFEESPAAGETAAPLPTGTGTAGFQESPAAGETAVPLQVCLPFADLTPGTMEEAITNPFHPPPFGSDDPHQGVDLAVFLPGTRVGIAGAEVRAVLGGVVSLVVRDRFPYGNALMIETPLQQLLDAGLALPEPDGGEPVASALTCPGETDFPAGGPGQSLYLLYAHLQDPPQLAVGEEPVCGAPVGRIGDSGNALNPHLHLEARVGPAGVVFPGMSHYSGAASPAEMDAYCAWRIGGAFRPVDPVLVLTLAE